MSIYNLKSGISRQATLFGLQQNASMKRTPSIEEAYFEFEEFLVSELFYNFASQVLKERGGEQAMRILKSLESNNLKSCDKKDVLDCYRRFCLANVLREVALLEELSISGTAPKRCKPSISEDMKIIIGAQNFELNSYDKERVAMRVVEYNKTRNLNKPHHEIDMSKILDDLDVFVKYYTCYFSCNGGTVYWIGE